MGWVRQATQKVTTAIAPAVKAVTAVTQPIEKAVVAPISNAATQFVRDPAKAVTAAVQPVEKAVTAGVADTSKNLTSALQPVEKAVTALSQDPKALVAIAIAVAAPYASAQIAAYLTTAGLSEAAAVAAADAITSITIQTAQGVPIEKATENALTNLAISGVNNQVAKQVGTVISKPEIASAISSTVTSGLTTAAKGGSQADVEKAMTAGLVSSAASTAYKQAVDSSSTVASKAVGGAAGGAVTGGTEGAVVGGLSSTASALGSDLAADLKAKNKAAADTAALPPSQVAALEGAVSPDTTSQSDVDTGQASTELIPSKVAPLDITQDQSAAETARLAAKEQQILDLITPAPAATEPKQGAYLPDTASATTEPKQGAFLPETATAPAEIPAADPMSKDPAQKAADKQILDLISETPTEDQSDAETERLARKEAELAGAEKGAYLPDSGTDTKTTTYKPDLFTTTYLSPKTRTAAAPASALGSALGTTGLTSYRGAGEIEGTGSGKPRKNVWNVESLKLKDALGV